MHEKVVEANRAWYSRVHGDYDAYRTSDDFLSWYAPNVRGDIAVMNLPADAEVLDCCAGNGTLGRFFADAGCNVTSVDLSAEMLNRIEYGHTIVADVVEWLAEASQAFDVVAFGAALHHLWDYEAAVQLGYGQVRPGGYLYIVGDPIRQESRAGRAVRKGELVLRKARTSPGDVVPAIRRRLKFRKSSRTAVSSPASSEIVGLYAEVHASHGIALSRILRHLPEPEVLRRHTTGPAWQRAMKRVVPGYAGDNFTLLARRPD